MKITQLLDAHFYPVYSPFKSGPSRIACMFNSLLHAKHVTGKAMLKWMNEQLYSKWILGDSSVFKKKFKWCLWSWALAFWLLDEDHVWLCWTDKVSHKTHIVTEAQRPMLVNIIHMPPSPSEQILSECHLGIHCPYTSFLTQVWSPICFPLLEWRTKVIWLLLLSWISCVWLWTMVLLAVSSPSMGDN